MRTNVAWTEVQPSEGNFERLPEGAYIIRITDVKDDTQREAVTFTFDIAEGEYAGFYNDAWGQQNKWAHQFTRWYDEKSESQFAGLLHQFEDSNERFHISSWQAQGAPVEPFQGLYLGVVMRKRIYTATKGRNAGKTAETIEVGRTYRVNDIREGNWKPMEPRDTRKQEDIDAEAAGAYSTGAAAPMDPYGNDNVPF